MLKTHPCISVTFIAWTERLNGVVWNGEVHKVKKLDSVLAINDRVLEIVETSPECE